VLDLGCGSGVPIARSLADAGYRVTGIDISEVQVRRARERVPQADFIQVDATAAFFDDASFDAVVSLYALIHIPLAEQPPLLHYAEGGREPGVGVTAAQVGQDEQGLPVRGQAPPAGADLSAALGKLPGQEAQM
jgi:2-polyprenyl-3-methyl-5-hydroxy-6-metoxy-1,4-benzoquinol methylase